MSKRQKSNAKNTRQAIKQIVGELMDDLIYSVKPSLVPPITEWVESNINLSSNDEKPSYLDLKLTPYLREPLERAAEYKTFGGNVEITLTGIEQLGKTIFFCSVVPFFAKFYDESSLITYRSKEFAETMNKEKLLPIMRNISEFRSILDRRSNLNKDFYQLPNCKVFFQGSENIMGVSYPIVINDEVDKWVTHAGKPHPLDESKKRMRTFNDSLAINVCSPHKTAASSVIYKAFLKGSRGYYHLKCLNKGCNNYIASFQISTLDKGEVDPKTGDIISANIRLICPECGYRHIEKQKVAMIQKGRYIHQQADRFKHRKYSFQVGALASQFAGLSWDKILNEQKECGSKAPIEKQILFANSFKGLPFQRKTITNEELKQLKVHCMSKPERSEILAIMMSIDTQQKTFKFTTRAMLKGGRSFLLDYGELSDILAVKKYYLQKIFYSQLETKTLSNNTTKEVMTGINICCGIWDEGGHISKIVQKHAVTLPGMMIYKGFPLRGGKLYEMSKSNSRRINGDKKSWNANFLHYLLTAENPQSLGLPWNIKDDYLREVNAARPPNNNYEIAFEKWDFGKTNRQHDYFDTEKMWFLLKHYMTAVLTVEQWLQAKGESTHTKLKKANKPRRQATTPLKLYD